ncbi:MAG: hypothetical protein ACI4BI_01920 [Anaerotardibacter sp.]
MKVSREHKALVLFFALALAGLGFAFFYITNLGHSWNVAASAIDDMSGELRGYTVILSEGTVSKSEEGEEEEEILSPFELKFVDDLNKKSQTDAANKSEGAEGDSEGAVGASENAAGSSESVESNPEEAASSNSESEEAVFDLPSLKRSYAEKGAAVFVLQLADPSRYLEKTIILGGGGNSFGIMTVDQNHCSEEYIESRIEEYKKSGVDLIIAITTSYDLISDYSDINAVISVSEEGLSDNGVSSDGVFYKDATKEKSISTIIVSQSRVFSAKEVSSL